VIRLLTARSGARFAAERKFSRLSGTSTPTRRSVQPPIGRWGGVKRPGRDVKVTTHVQCLGQERVELLWYSLYVPSRIKYVQLYLYAETTNGRTIGETDDDDRDLPFLPVTVFSLCSPLPTSTSSKRSLDVRVITWISQPISYEQNDCVNEGEYREVTWAGIAQSVWRLATGWTVPESNPGGGQGARFSAPVQTGPEARPNSYTMGTGSFPGVKRAGRCVDHSLLSSAEVEGRVRCKLVQVRFRQSYGRGRTVELRPVASQHQTARQECAVESLCHEKSQIRQ